MFAGTCSKMTYKLSAFCGVSNEADWYGHRLLERSIREVPKTDSGRCNSVTDSHSAYNLFQNSHQICTFSSANLNVSPFNGEYWQQDSSIMDNDLSSRTVQDGGRTSVSLTYIKESKLTEEKISPRSSHVDIKKAACNVSSEVSAKFSSNLTVDQRCQRSIEIKVEVDPNVYVNCEDSGKQGGSRAAPIELDGDDMDARLRRFYKLQCERCHDGRSFADFELLTQHSKLQHHAAASVSCCDRALWGRGQLVEHMLAHRDSYRCAECCKAFDSKSVWRQHMRQHVFRCLRCDKQFSSKHGLANHRNLHLPEGERPYKCQHCNKGFGAKHAMTKHERTHLPDEERLSYVCDVCGKRFGYASTLDGHQRHVHQKERPFVCHVCAKSFPIKGALMYHLTTHEAQQRVQCAQCGIWLKNEKILRIHRKCHQGELFACPHCDKVSSTRNNLRMHMKRHSNTRPHGCPLCSRAFKTSRDLKTHMVQHTGQKPYSCPHCPKTFASPSNFYAHRKTKHKPHQC
ncbi:zinc finger protein 260-like [Periplaneta americana]|uniref:zinc finger protein 260-like n=1 Tax=Periplaneta americana TaxID=6978 RepID=UPI0037E6FDA8